MNPRWAVGALLIGGALLTVSAYFEEHQATLAPPPCGGEPSCGTTNTGGG